ncbi:lipid kinase, YegS/Rv2252/BmrU family [Lachnospiraceae bacterium]|nr:lipid kinase, YegS/Rv2252/BmrU family [Lachnospiraceae bacterium]
MGKKLLFIYNPHAGMAKIRNHLIDIIDTFSKAGYEVTVCPTQKQGDAINWTREKSGFFDLVVCSGGDGTLDEVVTGMLQRERRVPIGYVPAGSTNDFAETLKIPTDMLEAADVVVDGRLFSCDMGRFNYMSFVYVAAFGIFTDVSYETKQDLKNTFGHLAYLIEAATRLPQIKSYHMRVKWEDGDIEDDFLFGMISNSLSVGGIKYLTGPDVVLDDGLFEVTLIRTPKEVQDYTEIAGSILTNSQSSFVVNFKSKRIRFESLEEVPWTLDGEFGGRPRVVELENMHKALQMIVPKDVELPCMKVAIPDKTEEAVSGL